MQEVALHMFAVEHDDSYFTIRNHLEDVLIVTIIAWSFFV